MFVIIRFRFVAGAIPALLLLAVAMPTAAAANSAALLARAQQLLSAGQAAAAFNILDAAESTYSNNVSFNYLHGVAALDAGQPGIAIFSLQRASLQDPSFAGARLELARAYYAAGNTERAEREFEQLLLLRPPADVVDVIERYLAAGKLRRKQYSASGSVRVAATAGYDSNANGGLDRDTVPGLLLLGQAVELPKANRETSSPFQAGSLKLYGQLPLNALWRLTAAADAELKEFSNASQVDSVGFGAKVGLDYSLHKLALTTTLSSRQQAISDNIDYSSNHAAVTALFQPNNHWLLRGGLSYGRLRFNDELENRDVNQQEVTFGAHRLFSSGWLNGAAINGFIGRDQRPSRRSENSENWSRRLSGLQLSISAALSPKWQLTTELTGITSRYDDAFGLRDQRREDITRIVSLNFKRQQLVCSQCSLQLAFGHLNQSSNDQRFDFDSTTIAISVERSF